MATMTVGTITEIKNNENRVGITPQGATELTASGVRVLVQKGAGLGSGFSDAEYVAAGAEILETPEAIVESADILVKVKEPIPAEYHLLDLLAGKTLYTYLHLSGVPKSLTDKLLETKITAIAYETIADEQGGLPCLAPMSEIAGVLAVQYGAEFLQKKHGGRGLTLGQITNAESAHTVIIGGGVVGTKSAQVAAGMGGKVTILDINPTRVAELKQELQAYLGDYLMQNVTVAVSDQETLAAAVKAADILVGAVLVAGKKAPRVVSEELVKAMQPGAVVVDVAIDQGGCIWGAKATTHSEPVYNIDDKIFCCVANMPGQAARQSTIALTTVTLPYLIKMATQGVLETIQSSDRFAQGLNTYNGGITFRAVAEDWDMLDKLVEIPAGA